MKIVPRLRHHKARVLLTCLLVTAAVSACSNTGASSGAAASLTVGSNVSVQQVGTTDSVLKNPSSVCGTKPMIVGIADGLGQNSWSALSYKLVEDEARMCPNTTKVIRTAANGDPSKAVSDINSLVAQGANVITVVPDAGPVGPAMRKAMQAGVAVVTWGAPATGAQVGRDMVDNVQVDRVNDGLLYGQFLIQALGGKGNILLIGGPAGNSITPLTTEGVKKAFAGHPGMKILNDPPAITNWDPASTQQVVATLLNQYPQIDGIVTEAVQVVPGIIQAFANANRPLVPITMQDGPMSDTDSRLTGGCLYVQQKPSNPKLQIAAATSGNFVGEIALRKAIAAYQGTVDHEPSIVKVGYVENSLTGGGLEPKC